MAAALPPCVGMFLPPPDNNGVRDPTQPPVAAKRPLAVAEPCPVNKRQKPAVETGGVHLFYKSRVLEVVRAQGCSMSHHPEWGTLVGLDKVLREFIQHRL